MRKLAVYKGFGLCLIRKNYKRQIISLYTWKQVISGNKNTSLLDRTITFDKILVVVCLHGNEQYGLKIIKDLPKNLRYVIANQKAVKNCKRFIDCDLNRCFPGDKNGNYEEKLAYKLANELKKFDFVIDLHSSSGECPLFGIITKKDKLHIDFARKMGLKKLVVMSKEYASGKSLIDFAKTGISLEIGPHERKENVKEVLDVIYNLLRGKENNEMKIFQVFSIVKQEYKDILIKNFKYVKKRYIMTRDKDLKQFAKYDFVPAIVSNKPYNNVLCLACKRI